MKSLVSRDEVRRLEKAAREKDKTKLYDWARQFEVSISSHLQDGYEKLYQNELANGLDVFLLSSIYVLLNDENVEIKEENLEFFIDNFHKVLDGFRTGNYIIEDFTEKLRELGLKLEDYHYEHRVTDIIVFVIDDKYEEARNNLLKKLKEMQVIILELDNFKGDEKQIRKNVDMINMCTKMYYLGDSDIINSYIKYAIQIKKPVVEALFSLHENVENGLRLVE